MSEIQERDWTNPAMSLVLASPDPIAFFCATVENFEVESTMREDVLDFADRSSVANFESDLISKNVRESILRLVFRTDLPARAFPKACHESDFGSPDRENLLAAHDPGCDGAHWPRFRLRLLDRKTLGIAARARVAAIADGAIRALGTFRRADRGAELHQGFVKGAGGVRGLALRHDPLELSQVAALRRVEGTAEVAGQHARDVAVHGGQSSPVGQLQDGADRVAPHPWQGAGGRRIARKLAGMVGDDHARSRMEVSRPPVVSEPRPLGHHVLDRADWGDARILRK